MRNHIVILAKNRTALENQKRQIRQEAEYRIGQIDEQIKEIDSAIATINTLVEPYLCKRCKGEGWINTTDAAGSRDEITCPTCAGTGIDKNAKIGVDS